MIRQSLVLTLFGVLLATLLSCTPQRSMAVIDEYYAALDPEGTKALSRAVRELKIIQGQNLSAEFYRVVQEAEPSLLYVSPLLLSETKALTAEYTGLRIASWGTTVPEESETLTIALFSQEKAAEQAIQLIRGYLDKQFSGQTMLTALLVSAETDPLVQAAFETVFGVSNAADPTNQLLLIQQVEGISESQIAAYKAMDIAAAVLFAPATDIAVLAEKMFDSSTYVVSVNPFMKSIPEAVDVQLSWDVPAAIHALQANISKNNGLQVYSDWKITKSDDK
ncbi:MAG: hypothetical protein KKI09_01015 [Spirochaetes bacterium]|nr:hypothetical protein [Spirochaetota bacterium]MBU0953981.1 hypothetical protein [Spirochaetota bacterium]